MELFLYLYLAKRRARECLMPYNLPPKLLNQVVFSRNKKAVSACCVMGKP